MDKWQHGDNIIYVLRCGIWVSINVNNCVSVATFSRKKLECFIPWYIDVTFDILMKESIRCSV